MKISTRLIGKQLRGSGGSFAEEEQKKNTAARKYFLDYYQGLRSPVTAKYCVFLFFLFSLLCGKQGKPVERGGRLLLIGRKRGFRPPACMRERGAEERVYKCKRKKTSVCIRATDVRLMRHELSRGMNLCRRSCERMPQVDAGGKSVSRSLSPIQRPRSVYWNATV